MAPGTQKLSSRGIQVNHEVTRGVLNFKTKVRIPVGSSPFGSTVKALQYAPEAHSSLVEVPSAVARVENHEVLAGLLLVDACRGFQACPVEDTRDVFLVLTFVSLHLALPGVEAHEAYGPYVMPT